MSGFVNLDLEQVNAHLGREIEYFELWNERSEDFKRGRSLVHGTYQDESGKTRVYADLIWGDSLDMITEDEGGFCFELGAYVYVAPEPFELYKITWENELGLLEHKVVPIDAGNEIEIEMVARLFTKGDYYAIRVNLDGTNFNPF